jgi:Tol biopolymer transport system component
MAFSSTSLSFGLQSVEFEPETATVGDFPANAPGVRDVASPNASPDGEWIAFSRVGIQEDIVLVRANGAEPFPLMDDPHRDRHPRWSPDGRRIAFYSNRSGSYEIWSVSPDGSRLEQLTDTPDRNLRYPIWSPDGTRMAFSNPRSSGTLFDPRKPWQEQTPEPLPLYPQQGSDFVPMDWSPDGRWLVGYIQSASGIRAGIAVYSLETGAYQPLTDFGLNPVWLADSRRVLFQAQSPYRSREQHNYQQDYKLYVVDRQTKEFKEVVAVPGASLENPTLTKDNHKLFVVLSSVETDIWTTTLDERP